MYLKTAKVPAIDRGIAEKILGPWGSLQPQERLLRLKEGQQPRLRPTAYELLGQTGVEEWLKSVQPAMKLFDDQMHGHSIFIAPILMTDSNEPLHNVYLDGQSRYLPCFGEFQYTWFGNGYHNRVAGAVIHYSKGTIERATYNYGGPEAAKELTDWLMSEQSPWWPCPRYVEIRDRFRALPATMFLHDTNLPSTLLVNFLIAFRSMIFDPSTLRTYWGLRGREWSVREAFFGTSLLWADDHPRSPRYSTEHRQVEYPITGETVARGLTSFRKFEDASPTILNGMAFWKDQTGIPNNLIWDRRQGESALAGPIHEGDVSLPAFMGWDKDPACARLRNGWQGKMNLSNDELWKIREFVYQS